MAKDPAFLFYYQDFLVGTDHMTNEQVGAYIRCLCHQSNRGSIRKLHMKNICTTEENYEIVKEKFSINEAGEFYNKRLADEIDKRKTFCESRRLNIQQRYKCSSLVSTSELHMENENENENLLNKLNNKQYNIQSKVKEIINYLNNKTGSKFNLNSKANINLIKARLNEGRSVEDFKIVIDKKCNQWLTDEKMLEYLRPKTLFNATNFENYLNQKGAKDDIPAEYRTLFK